MTKETITSLATALNAPYIETVNKRRREVEKYLIALSVGKDENSRRRCFCEFGAMCRPAAAFGSFQYELIREIRRHQAAADELANRNRHRNKKKCSVM